MTDTFYVYVLKLQNDCYYVGSTKKFVQRMDQHLDSKGSLWTKLNPPLYIENLTVTTNRFEEDRMVKQYMCDYGIDKVRGGSYCTKILTNKTKEFLIREIRHAKGQCLICGSDTHFIRDCKRFSPNY